MFGWNENTYKSHEQGIRGSEGIKPKHLRKYARAYGVSMTWLAFGQGSPNLSPEDAEWQEMSEDERSRMMRLWKAAQGIVETD